jgi:deoxyribodipyrimidine photolyase-related protein
MRDLILVLGDQLDRHAPTLQHLDPARDAVALVEVEGEATLYPNHIQRVALFLLAMRAFTADLRAVGVTVHHLTLEETRALGLTTFGEALDHLLVTLKPTRVRMLEAGRWGLENTLGAVCAGRSVPWEVVEDPHFLCSRTAFAAWARGRKVFLMEHFYRWMRRREGVLLEGKEPVGGQWNFDHDNRASFGAAGPGLIAPPPRFPLSPDEAALLESWRTELGLSGDADPFDWPRTPEQAEATLQAFLDNHLDRFGRFQDALWEGQAWLHHSRLSAAMNLHLIDPRHVIAQAVARWEQGRAPLAAVEGFVRQVLGWREFIRGIYWTHMPDYESGNALEATEPLPPLFWNAGTRMRCMGDVAAQLHRHAYAHHIQRLMVAGLFAQLLGVRPLEVHHWFMAWYVDAVEWVTLPNVIGMSQWADGGVVGTKPYVATGRYIQRQSNHCEGCPYDPAEALGEWACPFTTLYWAFLDQHRDRFARHPRMALQVRNLRGREDTWLADVRDRATEVRRMAQEGTL